MKKFAEFILTAVLSLSLFSAGAYAEEIEYTEIGTFTVLASQCNRGMMHTDVYFGTADPPTFVCGSFRIYEGECEVSSDGSPEGEAALEYYRKRGISLPGLRRRFIPPPLCPTALTTGYLSQRRLI